MRPVKPAVVRTNEFALPPVRVKVLARVRFEFLRLNLPLVKVSPPSLWVLDNTNVSVALVMFIVSVPNEAGNAVPVAVANPFSLIFKPEVKVLVFVCTDPKAPEATNAPPFAIGVVLAVASVEPPLAIKVLGLGPETKNVWKSSVEFAATVKLLDPATTKFDNSCKVFVLEPVPTTQLI
jgi:hypothetical protein